MCTPKHVVKNVIGNLMEEGNSFIHAYTGTAPYIFVSYAHLDSAIVLPILSYLINHGYNIWYDEGITPGEDWTAFLEDKIKNCACFLCFLSANSLKSSECLKELRHAKCVSCKTLNVFLEPVELPEDLRESLLCRQGIEYWKIDKKTDFYIKLLSHNLFASCKETEEFLISQNRLLRYNGNARDIIVPSGATQIGFDAFEGNQTAVLIRIHEQIDRIGKFAFNGMTALQVIDVAADNAFFESVDGVLYNKALNYLLRYPPARSDDEYIVQDGVKNVAIVAFAGAVSLRSITLPQSVTMVGDRAFESCRNLVEVHIQAAITQMRSYTFSRCVNLLSVKLPSSLRIIGDGAFSGCSSLISLDLPLGIESIGEMVFAHCESLISFSFPPHIEIVAEYCFHECHSLRVIDLSHVVSVKQYAFKNCESLERIDFSSELRVIERAAFSGCKSLQTVVLPDTVESLGEYSFDRCTSLEEFVCGVKLKRIEKGAFAGDFALRRVCVPASIEYIAPDAFENNVHVEYV